MSTVRDPLRMDLRSPSTTIIGCVLPASLLTGLKSPSCAARNDAGIAVFDTLERCGKFLFYLILAGIAAGDAGMPRRRRRRIPRVGRLGGVETRMDDEPGDATAPAVPLATTEQATTRGRCWCALAIR